MTSHRYLRGLLAATTALLISGCQSLVLGYANQGVRSPDATVVYDIKHDLSLDIYKPTDRTTPAPVVVFFYGGSWKMGERAQYRFVGERLAKSGVVAIVADYRTFPRTTFPGFVKTAHRRSRGATHTLPSTVATHAACSSPGIPQVPRSRH